MDWEPIKTAPKDALILALGTAWGDWGYTPDEEVIYLIRWNGKNWAVMGCTPRYFNGFTPQYWIPIPDPPQSVK